MQQDRWHAAAGTMNVQEAFPFSLELESSVGEYTSWAFAFIWAFADDMYSYIARASTDKLSLLYSTRHGIYPAFSG